MQSIRYEPATQTLHCLLCRRSPTTIGSGAARNPETMLLIKESFAARHSKCIGPAIPKDFPRHDSVRMLHPVDRDAYWRTSVSAGIAAI
jgi:hypothetical protein